MAKSQTLPLSEMKVTKGVIKRHSWLKKMFSEICVPFFAEATVLHF